jgi:hypothetical protein
MAGDAEATAAAAKTKDRVGKRVGWVMAFPTLKYQIAGGGWPVNGGSLLLAPATIVDTSQPQWSFLASTPPPIDAIALDQTTWNFMTSSNGVIGQQLPCLAC